MCEKRRKSIELNSFNRRKILLVKRKIAKTFLKAFFAPELEMNVA